MSSWITWQSKWQTVSTRIGRDYKLIDQTIRKPIEAQFTDNLQNKYQLIHSTVDKPIKKHYHTHISIK